MLVLSRKVNEHVVIGGQIRVTVVSIRGNQVRIGFEAPPEVPILREELVSALRSTEFSDASDYESNARADRSGLLVPSGTN
jgi:carbon storage regulator